MPRHHHPGAGGPGGALRGDGRFDALDAFFDEILEDRGITAPDGATERLEDIAETLDTVIEGGGTVLPDRLDHRLERLEGALDRAAEDGQSRLGSDAISSFVERHADTLSDEAEARLGEAQTRLDDAFADGSISADDAASLEAAADLVAGVREGDFVKLSDDVLTDLTEGAVRIDALVNDGFFALSADELAAVEAADALLEARSDELTDEERELIAEALAEARDALTAPVFGLARAFGDRPDGEMPVIGGELETADVDLV